MITQKNTMETMKAVTQYRYGGPDILNIEDVEKPSPKSDELLIRVHSVPISTAGIFMREGTPYIGRLAIGLFKPKNSIPGVGFSGEVEAIGTDVDQFAIGDKVFGETLFKQGTHAEYVCVSQNDTIAIKPDNITHAEAAPVCDGHMTSMNFLNLVADLKAGQSILIIGASGSLGTSAVQLAVDKGAHVTGVCSTANVELVRSIGAQRVIDYKTTDFRKEQLQYDIIYDTVGKSSFNACKPVLSEKGIYMSPVLDFKLLCETVWTSFFSKKKAKFSATGFLPHTELKRILHDVRKLIIEEKLVTVIDRKYAFDQVSEAHSYVDTGRKRGNVVLNVIHRS